MTTILGKTDRWLSGLYDRIKSRRSLEILTSGIIYTVLFAFFFWFIYGYAISWMGGYLLGGDGVEQYFPFLVEVRRMLIQTFGSIADGSPSLPMVNFNYAFGGDNMVSALPDYMPALPLYALSVFFPEELMPQFITFAAALFMYLSGISFICLCVHFGESCILSSAIAPFWSFCAVILFNLVANPHFLYMPIAFPLMIIGIDRIINNAGGILFTLSVTFLALCGIHLLVYTMPFVIIFAAIRVYYVYKGHYWKNLGKYFLIGTGFTLLGMMIAGVILIPYTKALIGSERSVGDIGAELLKLLIPSLDLLSQYVSGQSEDTASGTALIPFVLYALAFPRASRQLRTYQAVSLVLASIPLIDLALNAFQYSLDRWGFVYTLAPCYACVKYLPELARADGRVVKYTAVSLGVFALSYTLLPYELAALPPVVFALIAAVPPFRKAAAAVGKRLSGPVGSLFKGEATLPVKAAAALIALLAVLGIICMAAFKAIHFFPVIIAVAVLMTGVTVLAYKSGKAAVCTVLAAAVCLGTQTAQAWDYKYMTSANQVNPYACTAYRKLAESLDGEFIRCNAVIRELLTRVDYDDESDKEYSDKIGNIVKIMDEYSDDNNMAYLVDIPDAGIFNSVISGDLIRFASRLGQEVTSVTSTGQFNGFGYKDPLYSIFGISKLLSVGRCDELYGAELSQEIPAGGDITYYVYDYPYALPLGVAYDTAMSRERYESFGAAELPHAMMNEVWLDGYGGEAADTGSAYAHTCGITHEKTLRGTTETGMECYDNTVAINEDVSGCFVYITFDDVVTGSTLYSMFETTTMNKDGRFFGRFRFFNEKDTMQFWKLVLDSYTLPIGYCENDVNELTFISTFAFSSLSVHAVPVDEFIAAYEDRCRDVMYNVDMGMNTLTGEIDLPEDEILSVSFLYSDGWTAYIDGVQSPIYKANGLFIGIPLTAGHHDIRLVYHTPLIYEGAACTCAGIVILVVIAAVSAARRKKKMESEQAG